MHNQDDNGSICASFSDFCSLGQRVPGSRQNLLKKQNSRLRRQYSEISQKYFKTCNQLTKSQSKLIEKQKKMTQLDLFYRKQVQQLKKQLLIKNNEISKLTRNKMKKSCDSNKQNWNQNTNNEQYLQTCLENQSMLLVQTQTENNKLNIILNQLLQIFEPYIKQKQNEPVYKRISLLRRQLNQKSTSDKYLQKANNILQQNKRLQKQEETSNWIKTLKTKTAMLKKTPITFDYDVEHQQKNLQILFTSLDVQLRLLKQKKCQPE